MVWPLIGCALIVTTGGEFLSGKINFGKNSVPKFKNGGKNSVPSGFGRVKKEIRREAPKEFLAYVLRR